MTPKIVVAYEKDQFDKHPIELIATELHASGVELDLTEVTPNMQTSALDFTMLHYGLPNEFWNDVAPEPTKAAIASFLARLWQLAKGKRMNQITGRAYRVISNHYIHIPRTIEERKHSQYFLVSNRLSKDAVVTGIAELPKASKKIARKDPLSEHPYREEYVRLTKRGKWKRIKDMPKFRAKLSESNREIDKLFS